MTEHPAHPAHPNDPALDLLTKGWSGLLSGPGLELLEQSLKTFLPRQRWFGAKSRTIASVHILDWAELPAPTTAAAGMLSTAALPAASSLGAALFFLEIAYTEPFPPDTYQLPLAYASGTDRASIEQTTPNSIVATLETPTGPAILHDAVAHEDLRQTLLHLIAHSAQVPLSDRATAADTIAATLESAASDVPEHLLTSVPAPGTIQGQPGTAFSQARGTGPLPARISSAEQSNTNIFYGDRLLLKLFRRLQPGLNPDIEIGRFLTEVAHFPRIAPFLGEITLIPAAAQESVAQKRPDSSTPPPSQPHLDQRGTPTQSSQPTSLAMLQSLIPNEGDGWSWTLAELARYFSAASAVSSPLSATDPSLKPSLEAASLLGRRTAEMHLALATPTSNAAFAAEPFTSAHLAADARRIEAQLTQAFTSLETRVANQSSDNLNPDLRARVQTLLNQRSELTARASAIGELDPAQSGQRIRIHGDYHLGQVLRARVAEPANGATSTPTDYVILDFEGEPARTLDERRAKQSPLKDVAGMIRSFSYAAYSGSMTFLAGQPYLSHPATDFEQLTILWANSCASAFLSTYNETIAAANSGLLPPPGQAAQLLNAYLLEKALYELLYELNNRPTWLYIPLAGILNLPR